MVANLTPIILNATVQNATLLNTTIIQLPQQQLPQAMHQILVMSPILSTYVSLVIASAAIITAFLAMRSQNINRDLIREDRFYKEMDSLIKILYSNKDNYKDFEPQHVDYNNDEEVKKAEEFWKQIKENRYLAPKELGNKLDDYLERVEYHEQRIKNSRITLSTSISGNVPDELIFMIGEKGLVKPLPIHEKSKTEYENEWQEKIIPSIHDTIKGMAMDYFDVIKGPYTGPKDLNIRQDVAKLARKRYKELEKEIAKIKKTLESKH